MAESQTVAVRRKIGLRQLVLGVVGRVIRRSFFRLVFLFVLLIVAVYLSLVALANRGNANRLLNTVSAEILDSAQGEVVWDQDRTDISGPSLAGTGEITYHNVSLRRKGGVTAHPERGPLTYDFLTIPEVRLFYDLKRLPGLPVSRVEFPSGLVLHFNIHRGTWLDADLFKTGGGGGATPSLPELLVRGTATVKMRADGILVAPETLPAEGAPADWYPFKLEDLRLLPSLVARDQYALDGTATGAGFGTFLLGGSVKRDGTATRILFRTGNSINVNRAFVSILAPEVRRAVDQFQVEARADIKGSVDIVPGQPVQFNADVTATQGSLCFVGFPAAVNDASATIRIRNTALTVLAQGRRDGAAVTVAVTAEDVGGPFELLTVTVGVRDLLVDENFRKALLPARLQPANAADWVTGLPYSEEEWTRRERDPDMTPGYPEWPGNPTWDGGLIFPDVDQVLPFICRAFTPIGLANFELTLKSEAKGRTPEGVRTVEQDLNWKVFIRKATACYTGLPENDGDGFPIPLHECYGVVEGNNKTGQGGRYTIRGYNKEELSALGTDASQGMEEYEKDGLTGVLTSSGERVWIRAVYVDRSAETRNPQLRLELKSRGVDFNREFAQRLPVNVRNVVSQFAPQGKVDIQAATIEMRPDRTDEISYDFSLAAVNVMAEYRLDGAKEPMRFREIAGSLRIESRGNRVRLSNIRGKLLGSPIILDLQYNDGAVPSLRVQSDEFALKPELEDVLPPGVGTVLRRFKLTGFVSLDIRGRRGTDKPDFTEADISFLVGSGDRSGSMQFDAIPYQLTEVHGRAFVTVTRDLAHVVLRNVGGRGSMDPNTLDRARIQVSGLALVPIQADPDAPPGEPVFDLEVRAQRVPVDGAFLSALTPLLAQGKPEKPALVQFIEELNVRGTVGFHGRVLSDRQGQFDWRIEVYLEGTSVNYAAFPYPLDGLYGTVIVDGYEVALRNVTGRAEKGRFTLHHAGYSEADGWTVQVSARDLSFHETPTLRRALPVTLRNMFTRMNPKGEFDIDLEMSGKDEFMRFQVSLDVFSTDLDLGLHFDDLTARFDYEGVRDGGVNRGNGRMQMTEVFFKKARFNDVTSNIQFFGDRLEFPNLRGSFYDGWVAGRFGMEGDDYAGELEIRRADLRQLGATAFGTQEISGAMDSEIRFHSQLDNQGQIGRGRIDIGPIHRNSEHPDPKERARLQECKLAAVPLFNEIFKVAGGEQNFDEGHVYFWLGPDRITIREMDFVSDAARVEIFGGDDANYIAYGSAEMRMKLFFTIAPRSPIPLPGVQYVLDLLKQILFPLYVTGTLGEPKVEPFSLSNDELVALQDQFPRRPRGP
ncbi:MAG: hypothetical protein KF754_03675 [Planctomycetes bacterium]|nr:hypothetical protein [Planctomycetota bacterium]